MVPIADSPLLDLVLKSLEGRVRAINAAEPVVRAFAAWLGLSDVLEVDTLGVVAAEAAAREGASRSYQDVAVLGFAVDCTDSPTLVDRLRDGLLWMKARRFFIPNQPLGFEADALAIFGTALGIRVLSPAADQAAFSAWLTALARQSVERVSGGAWEQSLLRASCTLLGEPVGGIDAPDFAVILASRRLVAADDDIERRACQIILDLTYRNGGVDRAATHLAALRWLLRAQARVIPNTATVSDVARMLEAIPHSLKRWPWEDKPKTKGEGVTAQRWDIQHEYHFQSLLWALLAPVFPDLDDEEWLPSLGHKHPRVDLVIPSLKLMIEAKFLREGIHSALSGLIEEIAADTALYLANREDHRILVAIWDESRSTDQHAELKMGIGQLKGVVGTVIVTRPGNWARTA